jgi:hypothetical protein
MTKNMVCKTEITTDPVTPPASADPELQKALRRVWYYRNHVRSAMSEIAKQVIGAEVRPYREHPEVATFMAEYGL